MNDEDSLIVAEIKITYASALAVLYIFDDGTAFVSGVESHERRKGHATELLRQINEIADANGIELHLTAFPYRVGGGPGMSRNQLVDFYTKMGFVSQSIDRHVFMVRPASQKSPVV